MAILSLKRFKNYWMRAKISAAARLSVAISHGTSFCSLLIYFPAKKVLMKADVIFETSSIFFCWNFEKELSKIRACIQFYAAWGLQVNFHISAHGWSERLWRKTPRIWNYSVSNTERKFRKISPTVETRWCSRLTTFYWTSRLVPSSTTKNEKKIKKNRCRKTSWFQTLFIYRHYCSAARINCSSIHSDQPFLQNLCFI